MEFIYIKAKLLIAVDKLSWEMMGMSLNYAHRGASGYYPENTMLAFEKAVEMNCDGIETDVHLTKDKIPVLCHDEKIDRTTDGTGYIMDYTYEELCKFDAGIKYGQNYKGQRIPSLEEFLIFVAKNNIQINIELKNNTIEYEGLEQTVINMVYQHSMQGKVIISSFNHYSIMKCKSLDSKIKLGFLYDDPLYKPGNYGNFAGVDALHPNFHTLKDEVVENIRGFGLMINTYTVNNEEDMKRLIKMNIDVIITNYPDKLNKLLKP